jgi:hypothetical protein
LRIATTPDSGWDEKADSWEDERPARTPVGAKNC